MKNSNVSKKANLVNVVSNVITVANSTFIARRNEVYRVFYSSDNFEQSTKAEVKAEVQKAKLSYKDVTKVSEFIKSTKKDSKLFKKLLSACKFNVSVVTVDKKEQIRISYTVKQVLQAANLLVNTEKLEQITALSLEQTKYAEMIKAAKKKVKSSKLAVETAKKDVERFKASDSEVREIFAEKYSNAVSTLQKAEKVLEYLTDSKKDLAK